ncbi:MAG: hypothetical protein CM1200mP10_31160 [Candidatus Neomarinimicrobiota bacterium]|nr:MAG: hypothetical protein CM1200mP10_31160 [Candidatus Neomarinimicrobiota bacterium]
MLSLAETENTAVLVLTVDTSSRGNREGERWFRRQITQTSTRLGNSENYKGRMMIGDPSMNVGYHKVASRQYSHENSFKRDCH